MRDCSHDGRAGQPTSLADWNLKGRAKLADLTATVEPVASFANRDYRMFVLKAQDVMVAIRLALPAERPSTYPELSTNLRLSASEAHSSLQRAANCGLVDSSTRRARRAALLEFLVHGVRYVFPAVLGAVTRGVPTSYAAPPLNRTIVAGELPPVWPHPEGNVRGQGLLPIYRSVPDAALRDPVFHEWMALVDAVRAGRARERELAISILRERLS